MNEYDELTIKIGDAPEKDIWISFPGNQALPDSAWITVDPNVIGRPRFSLRIIRTDEGIVIDVFPYDFETNEPVASTYAFDSDVLEEQDD